MLYSAKLKGVIELKPEELFSQFQNLLENNSLTEAQSFLEENMGNLGDYGSQATEMLSQFDASGLLDSVGNLPEQASEIISQVTEGGFLETLFSIFKK